MLSLRLKPRDRAAVERIVDWSGWRDRKGHAPPVAPLIKVLDKSHLDLTTPLGRGFIAFLSAMVEDERQRIVKRADEGRVAARKRGARFGPQAQAQ